MYNVHVVLKNLSLSSLLGGGCTNIMAYFLVRAINALYER